jgi:hypothetical protein
MYTLSMKQFYSFARPSLILDDGRIVIFEMVDRLLQCYDPTTSNLVDVFFANNLVDVLDIGAMELVESQSTGVYTGSLLV